MAEEEIRKSWEIADERSRVRERNRQGEFKREGTQDKNNESISTLTIQTDMDTNITRKSNKSSHTKKMQVRPQTKTRARTCTAPQFRYRSYTRENSRDETWNERIGTFLRVYTKHSRFYTHTK